MKTGRKFLIVIKNSLDRNGEQYAAKVQARIEAGRKGGVAKQANASFATTCQANLANVAVPVPVPVNVPVPVPVNVHGNVIKSKSVDKPHTPAFTPPTIFEVKAYCIERENSVSAEKFIDFYTSKGWVVGKTKMKDWHAAVRTWEKSDFSKPAAPTLDVSRYDGWEKRRENN